MAAPVKAQVRKIVSALKQSKQKYVPVARLSKLVGVYPDVLTDTLVYFEPMIRLDETINTRDFMEAMEAYLAPAPKKEGEKKEKRVVVTKKELRAYPTIGDFVYAKYASIGGLIDRTSPLSDEDLHILQKLVAQEIAARKPKKATKKKKK